MKTLVPTSFLTLAGFICFAQPALQPDEMEFLFAKKRFSATWSYYQQRLKKDSLNSDLNYKMGVCYLNSRSQKEKAVSCFQKALAGQSSPSVITWKLLADACYLTYRYDQAVEYYEKYKKLLLESKDVDSVRIRDVNKQLEICRIGKQLNELQELNASLLNAKTISADVSGNYSCAEYTTSCSPDNSLLTFTFRRSFTKGKLYEKNLFEDKVLMPGGDTTLADTRDTTKIQNEATVASSIDGQIILTYRDEGGDANLYVATLNGNEWTTPQKLNKSLNSQGWEPNEFISADGNMLFFTSTREGGLGGKDIYVSMKQANGDWGRAVNLGYPINSAYDDEAPFIYPDGKTLYFSSNRLRKNSFDIFSVSFENGTWGLPVNVGYPVSKTPDVVHAQTTTQAGKGKDNCLVSFVTPKKTPLILAKGIIEGRNHSEPPPVAITLSDNATSEVMGLYQINHTGQYAFILPNGRNNNLLFEAEGYLFHSENMNISEGDNFYKIIRPIELQPFAENSSTFLNNIFFKRQEAQLETDSQNEIDHLFRLMADNPGLVIELAAYRGEKEKESAAQKLREDQVQTLCNTLLGRGIDKERIQTHVYSRPSKKKKRRKDHDTAEETAQNQIELKILKLNNLK